MRDCHGGRDEGSRLWRTQPKVVYLLACSLWLRTDGDAPWGISESAERRVVSLNGAACAAIQKTDFAWRNEAFRRELLKSLISFTEPNQPFRGIVSFQDLSRRFVSLFSHFLLAPISLPLLFKSDLIIIAMNSEKGKNLLG